jgi:acyl carrier protein
MRWVVVLTPSILSSCRCSAPGESLAPSRSCSSQVEPDDHLFGDDGLGLDSVDALELVMEVERRFGVQIQDDEKSREVLKSVRTLAEFLHQSGAKA